MNLHSNQQCKEKCNCIVGVLKEIQDMLEYPRSDREQSIKCAIDVALQDIQYLSKEIEDD